MRIPKLIFALFCLIIFSMAISAQESIQVSYERNFIRASLQGKTGVLLDAARDEESSVFLGGLYEYALQFALSNSVILRDDPDLILLVSTAARGAGLLGHRDSTESLLALFNLLHDSHSRVEILGALAILGTGNSNVTESLNRILRDELISFRAGTSPDTPVLRALINALGTLGEESSFPVLFSALTSSYPQAVIQDILRALDSIRGNHKDYLIRVIVNNSFAEKAAAFRLGAYNERLSPSDRGEIAQAALEAALGAALPERSPEASLASSLRYDAINLLTRLRWTTASSLAIRNFYRVQMDFMNESVPRERLLEAIACLGVMGTTEAAQALILQLGYKNSQTESSGEYDEAVMLALINALGELGDKAAFDHLLYISYLNYHDRIQASAREALNRLRW